MFRRVSFLASINRTITKLLGMWINDDVNDDDYLRHLQCCHQVLCYLIPQIVGRAKPLRLKHILKTESSMLIVTTYPVFAHFPYDQHFNILKLKHFY